jgi:hypothetical protein
VTLLLHRQDKTEQKRVSVSAESISHAVKKVADKAARLGSDFEITQIQRKPVAKG